MPHTEIKKRQVEEMVLFAINHVPQADSVTLKRFLELVNAGGTFGVISQEQILRKMYLVLKYIPNASVPSLLVLMDLLEIKPSRQFRLEASSGEEREEQATPFSVEVPAFMEARL
jgi:hypothetical protein